MNSPSPKLPTPVVEHVTQLHETFQRRAVIESALSWCGTPYRPMCAVKGPLGGVDCSMLLVRAWVEGGVFNEFDPRPYPSNWMLHRSDERYLDWLDTIGQRTHAPQPGDVIGYHFGRCTSHASIIVDEQYVVHAFASSRMCIKTERDWAPLKARETFAFDMWARLRSAA